MSAYSFGWAFPNYYKDRGTVYTEDIQGDNQEFVILTINSKGSMRDSDQKVT